MAIAYDGAGGLFTDAGKLIGLQANLRSLMQDSVAGLQAAITEIVTATADATVPHIDGLQGVIDQLTANNIEARKQLAAMIASRILDRNKIVNELHLPDLADLNTVLSRFREKMAADGKTVQRNVVTLGGLTGGFGTAAAVNIGNGTLFVTKVLDGYNKPGSAFPADPGYAGLDSEMSALAETITVECTSDSQNATRTEAAEQWKAYGHAPTNVDEAPTPYFADGKEGSGSSRGDFLTGPLGAGLVFNPGFDLWTADPTPNFTGGWAIDTGGGVLGTHVKQETVNVYRGQALALVGDGVQTLHQVYQPITVSNLRPRRRYLVSVRVKADAAVASGTFGVEFAGTGYAVGGTEKISLVTGAIPTVWTLKTFEIQMPNVIPADWRLLVKVTGTLSNGRTIYVDDVFLQPITYFGGVGMAVIPGAVRSMQGDRYSFTTANDNGGKIQTFWLKYFGRQLPSSNAPNISDALAATTAMSSGAIGAGPVGP